jgi:RNA polymerase sigma-70 factor (ECF subfamily)
MAVMTGTQLAEVFDALGAQLVLYARQWVSVERAEDVVQEVFENLKAWLLTCVRHAAMDAMKGERRRKKRDQAVGEERGMFSEVAVGEGLRAVELQRALEELPGVQREIITLRIWGEGTFEEIASIVKMPLSTVYQQYRSGLEMLRNRWESPCRKK